jgi:hypothetical protein
MALGWAGALADATAAPVLIAVADDSDTALLADSPAVISGSQCSTPRRAVRAGVADTKAMAAIAEEVFV